ncbi:MAG TPA: DUF1508 domain-containing protein [Clostridia bacterium]|nr:DUF1508 domain-containing protein [Clostridia bacterium]
MTQLFVQLAQSVTGNVIAIVALNIVAAAIGYFTAWLYAKSVYTPVIKGLEADKTNLNKQIVTLNDIIKGLEADKVTLNKQVAMLNNEISNLNEEVKKLKDETNDLNEKVSKLSEKNSKLEEEIAEKYKEIKELSHNTTSAGKYVISKAKNDEKYFNLKTTTGQTILTSQMYSSESACFNGIESVRNNCSDDSKFERKQSVNNKSFFVLKAANGQVIGTSAMYESEAGMENDIALVKKNGISTGVIEE